MGVSSRSHHRACTCSFCHGLATASDPVIPLRSVSASWPGSLPAGEVQLSCIMMFCLWNRPRAKLLPVVWQSSPLRCSVNAKECPVELEASCQVVKRGESSEPPAWQRCSHDRERLPRAGRDQQRVQVVLRCRSAA